MKPQEAELVSEISKLQCMVSELKTGFTSALLELNQIQHGDTYLREELEENRRGCQKKALRLEALVESLREELGGIRCQILQLHSNRLRPPQDGKSSRHRESSSDAEEATGDRRPECECPPAGASRGKLLLLCFLQGLKAGTSDGTDARHQVAMQLLHSEWEYVSALNQLCDKYRTPPAHQMTVEPYQTSVKFVEQLLQRHLLFRNSLQERLTAEQWKSLVGDVVVQLTGHNDTAFSDMYLGYTATLASFLSREFDGLNRSEKMQNMQSVQTEREEVKLLYLLLTPVSRIHGYLNHIQNLLQWTGTEHPDRSLLLGSERVLSSVLTRCHVILEEDVRWEEGGGGQSSCTDAVAGGSSAKCCTRSQQADAAAQRDDQQPVSNGVDGCHSMRLECWSCSPVRRRKEVCGRDRTLQNQPARGHACCSILSPDAAAWGEHSDSGQGSNSQLTGKGTDGPEAPRGRHGLEDCETDQDDTSAFDYSSVTSGSPDATLRRETTEEEEEEEDSQVPVLLKPSYSQQQQPPQPRERTVCLRWQIPRMTPHPPLRRAAGLRAADGPSHVGSYGKRLVTVRKGSPPLHPKSAFRPIVDDPSKQQVDAAPEKDNRQVFLQRQSFLKFNPSRETLRPGPAQQRGPHAAGGLWEESEDSEGPCSTV
ncbi:uncharacterized protein LOC130200970 [Pseudoliparis swirei]|uniref:uncharacterized protein LOC130200970 n=1 Tax=Pseudoliparis swirei TaxID=2059687 RepID=UPI0024BEED12|nr:uncharacterized protein LOC130200970 [Pseudoliparis swirei]